jgi:uncharacterized protein (AIM24 family)
MQQPNVLVTYHPRKISASTGVVQFAGIQYSIEGENVPVLVVDLNGQQGLYFEHCILLWKHPSVNIGMHKMKHAFRRIVAGLQIFMTEAVGVGSIGFSRDGPGQIVPIHLKHGQTIIVRENQFLAATSNIDYSFTRVKGVASMLMGESGYFMDTFTAAHGDGILWLHGYGNVFTKTLMNGESIDVEPGGWLFFDPSVQMTTSAQNLSTGLLASFNFITNRFTGPGNVGIQSMYLHLPTQN